MTAAEILEHGDDISLNQEALTANKTRFCEIWPSARQGLEMLKDLTKNPLVKSVISIVIAGGDVVSGRIC